MSSEADRARKIETAYVSLGMNGGPWQCRSVGGVDLHTTEPDDRTDSTQRGWVRSSPSSMDGDAGTWEQPHVSQQHVGR